jgi:hypothetical protein
LKENRVVWFWIGSHSEYDKLLKQLKSTEQIRQPDAKLRLALRAWPQFGAGCG